MKGEKKLNSQLEKLKNELDAAANNPDSNMEDLTKIACNIDKEIEKLYKPRYRSSYGNYIKYKVWFIRTLL